jgi:glycosyltransferase involved in cell wall biosynthesis
MKLTVAICTWNRASLLSRVLEQFTRIQHPSAAWEVVVVNNNSTDDTESVLHEFAGRLPLRSVFEPTPGLSHSRNTAVSQATGDYVVWTDDDSLVDVSWLVAYQRAIERWPDAAVFGGPVRPRFEGTPPQWLTAAWQEIRAAFATLDLGVEPFELDDGDKIPYGANFVVRMREQRQFAYDPNLGRKQGAGALGEETAVIRAILASGGTGRWVPDAVVEHLIPRERQTIRYLRNYYGLLGRTFYEWDVHGVPTLWGRPRWLWRKTLRAELRYILARSSTDPHHWLKPLVEASILWGAVRK